MNAKINYTHAELTHRSTTQLIAIYNRLFNTNIWDEMFNPYEARQEILMALFAEMRAQEVLAQLPETTCSEPYKALKIVVSADGFAIIWNTGEFSVSNRKVTDEQMRLIRQLSADGETMQWIADAMNIGKKIVFEVLSGRYAETVNRWNASADAPDQKRPQCKAVQNFKAAKAKAIYHLIPDSARKNNEYWTTLGL